MYDITNDIINCHIPRYGTGAFLLFNTGADVSLPVMRALSEVVH